MNFICGFKKIFKVYDRKGQGFIEKDDMFWILTNA